MKSFLIAAMLLVGTTSFGGEVTTKLNSMIQKRMDTMKECHTEIMSDLEPGTPTAKAEEAGYSAELNFCTHIKNSGDRKLKCLFLVSFLHTDKVDVLDQGLPKEEAQMKLARIDKRIAALTKLKDS